MFEHDAASGMSPQRLFTTALLRSADAEPRGCLHVTVGTAGLRCLAKIRAKLRGSNPYEPMEHSGEVAWVLESDADAGLANSQPLTSQKFFGAVDPLQQYKTVRRTTHTFFEQLTKVMGTHACQRSELREPDFIGEVLADVVEHALQPISGQAPFEESWLAVPHRVTTELSAWRPADLLERKFEISARNRLAASSGLCADCEAPQPTMNPPMTIKSARCRSHQFDGFGL